MSTAEPIAIATAAAGGVVVFAVARAIATVAAESERTSLHTIIGDHPPVAVAR